MLLWRRPHSDPVLLLQVLDPHYGMYVWPSAVVLAQYLWTQRAELSGRTVLEVRGACQVSGVRC